MHQEPLEGQLQTSQKWFPYLGRLGNEADDTGSKRYLMSFYSFSLNVILYCSHVNVFPIQNNRKVPLFWRTGVAMWVWKSLISGHTHFQGQAVNNESF